VKALNVHRDSIGSIVCKFNVKGTVLLGRDRKRKLSMAATRFLRSQIHKTLQ